MIRGFVERAKHFLIILLQLKEKNKAKNVVDYRFFECCDSVGDLSIVINTFIIPSSHD